MVSFQTFRIMYKPDFVPFLGVIAEYPATHLLPRSRGKADTGSRLTDYRSAQMQTDKSNTDLHVRIAESIKWYEGAISNEKNYLPGFTERVISENEAFTLSGPVVQSEWGWRKNFQVRCKSGEWLRG